MDTIWRNTMRDTVFVLKCTDGGKIRTFASPLSPERVLHRLCLDSRDKANQQLAESPRDTFLKEQIW